jgi:mono/diheme cytochrome c family protein
MKHDTRMWLLAVGLSFVGSVGAADPPGSAPAAAPPGQQPGKSVTTSLYTVQDGNKVDAKTFEGWKTWRALACERCHGASQEGLVGPSLLGSLKVLTKEDFHTTIMNGRPAKGMPNFSGSQMVVTNWENLYAYLKGRSDGNILPGHLYPLDAGASAQNQLKMTQGP